MDETNWNQLLLNPGEIVDAAKPIRRRLHIEAKVGEASLESYSATSEQRCIHLKISVIWRI